MYLYVFIYLFFQQHKKPIKPHYENRNARNELNQNTQMCAVDNFGKTATVSQKKVKQRK